MTDLQLFKLFVRAHRAAVLLEGPNGGPVRHEIELISTDLRIAIEKKLARPHRSRRRR